MEVADNNSNDRKESHPTSDSDKQVSRDDASSPKNPAFATASEGGGEGEAGQVVGAKLALLELGLCFSTLLAGLDFTVIATAIPVITTAFGSLDDVGWYGSAYFIAMCASQPLSGKIYTMYSKKIAYLVYIALFELGSLVCALAPTSTALIVGRAISGLGASGIFAGALITIATVAPLRQRALLTGLTNACFGAAQIVGPLIGGAFSQKVTWRWCFWINLPIGGVSALMILLFLKVNASSSEKTSMRNKIKSLDLAGFAVFAGAMIMLLLALEWGGTTFAWNSSRIIGLFVGFAVTFIIFCAWQWYMAESALVPPGIFHHRSAILAFASALAANGGFQTIIYYLPIWFQAVLGATPVSSGLRYLPTVISDVLTSIIGGILVMKFGWYNPFFLFGIAILAIGSGLLTTLYPMVNEGRYIGFQILCGCGYSFLVTMPHIALQSTLPMDLIPTATTTLLFFMTASCSIFLAIGQTIFQGRLRADLLQSFSEEATQDIISAGAAAVYSISTTNDRLSMIIGSYSDAATRVFFIPAAGAAVSFFLICGLEWKNTKATSTGEEKTQELVGDEEKQPGNVQT